MRKCLYCAEEIQNEAVKCKHCGEMLNQKTNLMDFSNELSTDFTMRQNQTQMNRPDKVSTAVMLLYIILGIGVLRCIIEGPRLFQMVPVRSIIFTLFCVWGTFWFFIYMIGRGRNWARITWLVLYIAGIPFIVLLLPQSLASYPISGLLGVGQIVLQLIALFFLFQKPSSEWFRQIKSGVKE